MVLSWGKRRLQGHQVTDWPCMALRCFMITLSAWGHTQRSIHRGALMYVQGAHWMLPCGGSQERCTGNKQKDMKEMTVPHVLRKTPVSSSLLIGHHYGDSPSKPARKQKFWFWFKHTHTHFIEVSIIIKYIWVNFISCFQKQLLMYSKENPLRQKTLTLFSNDGENLFFYPAIHFEKLPISLNFIL